MDNFFKFTCDYCGKSVSFPVHDEDEIQTRFMSPVHRLVKSYNWCTVIGQACGEPGVVKHEYICDECFSKIRDAAEGFLCKKKG